jgi:predicted enzyme related to lactoylglutathione lyase
VQQLEELMNDLILGLHTTWCQTQDMQRAVRFYRDVIGLEPAYTSASWSVFRVGDGQIGLHSIIGDQEKGASNGSGWVVGLQVADVRAVRHRLEEAGVHLADGYHEIPNGVILDFQDPDGNALQAVQLGVSANDLE